MEVYWSTQLAYFLRLTASVACGAAIGFERRNRLKEAGIRTHILVALASALMMIISKYGFYDVIVYDSISLDASRIAANIVSGVGFLGAGVIFVRRQIVSGLTTSAGIWATSGIGMAFGAGMYFMGFTSTAIIIVTQIVLHCNHRWFRYPQIEHISLTIPDSNESLSSLKRVLQEKGIDILSIRTEKDGRGNLEVDLAVKLPKNFSTSEFLEFFRRDPLIVSLEA